MVIKSFGFVDIQVFKDFFDIRCGKMEICYFTFMRWVIHAYIEGVAKI